MACIDANHDKEIRDALINAKMYRKRKGSLEFEDFNRTKTLFLAKKKKSS